MTSTRSSKRNQTKLPSKDTKKSEGAALSDAEERLTASQYFEKDSDASNVDSDAGAKKRRAPTRNSNKKSSPRKKRKTEEDEEEYDEAGETLGSPAKLYDSDALDDDDDFDEQPAKSKRKARVSTGASPKKARTVGKKKKQEASDVEFDDVEEGQEVVGVVVQAPTSGRVPPGQISQNTLNFLKKLQDPKYNDREWFKLNEPVYRLAEKEWKDFIEAFTDVLVEADPQIPQLPPKDVIHRIYRDVRFSNDKTPYKRNFSASFSRSGRKGIFAGYHLMVQPGNKTMFAAGTWCAGRNELANIRTNIQRNSQGLRNVISAPEFEKYFGKAEPHPKGEYQNIFGFEDELKVAPKGVSKDDKDIDLLKCRSFIVTHKFLDSEVLEPNFKYAIASIARVMQPFVHCLNDMMTIITDEADEQEDEDEDEE